MQGTMRATEMREKQVNVRLNPDEHDRAERVAKRYGLTIAYVVRMLLKREHDALFGATPEAPAPEPSRPRVTKKPRK